MSDGKVPGALRRKIMRHYDYTCVSCGLHGREARFDHGGFGFYTDVRDVYLSIDHIIPRSCGGTNDPDNLQVLCTECNTKKGTKIVDLSTARRLVRSMAIQKEIDAHQKHIAKLEAELASIRKIGGE